MPPFGSFTPITLRIFWSDKGRRGRWPPVDKPGYEWDIPTMSTTIADQKRRVVLPGVQPGDVLSVNRDSAGRLVLVRLLPERPKRRPQARQVAKALRESPLRPTLSWNELKRATRGL
jgi:hypothetical protein